MVLIKLFAPQAHMTSQMTFDDAKLRVCDIPKLEDYKRIWENSRKAIESQKFEVDSTEFQIQQECLDTHDKAIKFVQDLISEKNANAKKPESERLAPSAAAPPAPQINERSKPAVGKINIPLIFAEKYGDLSGKDWDSLIYMDLTDEQIKDLIVKAAKYGRDDKLLSLYKKNFFFEWSKTGKEAAIEAFKVAAKNGHVEIVCMMREDAKMFHLKPEDYDEAFSDTVKNTPNLSQSQFERLVIAFGKNDSNTPKPVCDYAREKGLIVFRKSKDKEALHNFEGIEKALRDEAYDLIPGYFEKGDMSAEMWNSLLAQKLKPGAKRALLKMAAKYGRLDKLKAIYSTDYLGFKYDAAYGKIGGKEAFIEAARNGQITILEKMCPDVVLGFSGEKYTENARWESDWSITIKEFDEAILAALQNPKLTLIQLEKIVAKLNEGIQPEARQRAIELAKARGLDIIADLLIHFKSIFVEF